jgi:aminoglycoside phosphotransferase family enzyme
MDWAATSAPSPCTGGYAAWLVAGLQDARVYGSTEPVELRETAISWVFLADDRAYKLKKAICVPPVDYSTPARRRTMCDEEVRLNRRLAPEIYLGVRGVVRDGARARLTESGQPRAVDHLVEMRRYDETATAAAALRRGESIPVAAIGERLAAFHADAAPCHAAGAVDAWRATLTTHFRQLRELWPARAHALSHHERLARAFLAEFADELERRAGLGLVRDGHGDLRAEHVLLTRPMAIVNCIEFDAGRRQIDVGADLARLKVDLALQGDAQMADDLVAAYRRAGGDAGDDRLLDFWCAYQCQVAAKVLMARHGHAAFTRADALLSEGGTFATRAAALSRTRRRPRPSCRRRATRSISDKGLVAPSRRMAEPPWLS